MRNRSIPAAICALLALFFMTPLHSRSARAQDDPRAAALSDLVQARADAGEFSGVALVADAGGVILERAYGPAVREWDVPNRADTRFRIGSLTKQFTAALVLSFVQEGRLDLDAPLTASLPWYRSDTGTRMTVRHLLNHTSGLDRSGVVEMITGAPTVRIPLREEIELYCSGDLVTEPGAEFSYNNGGYLILAALVEEMAGLPYAEVLAERILQPCGMQDTGMYDPRVPVERMAEGYDRKEEGWRRPSFIDGTLASGAGGAWSTAADLYRWDQALYTDTVLDAETRQAMFTPGPGPYGFGWFVMEMPVGPDRAARTVIRHPGQGDGYHSICWRIPEDRITVILLANAYRLDLDSIAEEILAVVSAPR